jgi:hypothetical protein
MNAILIMMLMTSVDLYYVKDSPDILVRITPQRQDQSLTLYYSFSKNDWDSLVVERKGEIFEARLKSPDIQSLKVVGIYFVYADGAKDDNNGALYLYELSIYPRLLMPFTLKDFSVMVEQARKKILSRTHVSEAIRLLDYMANLLPVVPYITGTQSESERDNLLIEVEDLKNKIDG